MIRLTKCFDDVVAVGGIDVEMQPGEFFSLLGPSGCGKTTTLRMIAGFEEPSEGRIMLDGTDVALTPPYKRNVNTVSRSYALFPHRNVFDNVAFGLRDFHQRSWVVPAWLLVREAERKSTLIAFSAPVCKR